MSFLMKSCNKVKYLGLKCTCPSMVVFSFWVMLSNVLLTEEKVEIHMVLSVLLIGLCTHVSACMHIEP